MIHNWFAMTVQIDCLANILHLTQ